MSRATPKQRHEFIHMLYEHAVYNGPPSAWEWQPQRFVFRGIRPIGEQLMRMGATYARIQELWCNGPQPPNGLTAEQYNAIQRRYDNETVPYYECKEARLEKRIRELCESIGCKAYFQGDPRGATVRVIPPDGFSNCWDRETGIAVPTS